jgi:hypothetical protein
MHRILLVFAVVACSSRPDMPSECGGECRSEDVDCTSFPYETLPARCDSICYEGRCCYLQDETWHHVVFDCARPVDASVDTPPDGANDA